MTIEVLIFIKTSNLGIRINPCFHSLRAHKPKRAVVNASIYLLVIKLGNIFQYLHFCMYLHNTT